MSAIQDCPACETGYHENHVALWNVREGLLGGSVCECKGDCEQRHLDRVAEWLDKWLPPAPIPAPSSLVELLPSVTESEGTETK